MDLFVGACVLVEGVPSGRVAVSAVAPPSVISFRFVSVSNWGCAQRLVARVGSREYSRLSVSFQLLCRSVAILFNIPSKCFYPVPRVSASVVKIIFHAEPPRPPRRAPSEEQRRHTWGGAERQRKDSKQERKQQRRQEGGREEEQTKEERKQESKEERKQEWEEKTKEDREKQEEGKEKEQGQDWHQALEKWFEQQQEESPEVSGDFPIAIDTRLEAHLKRVRFDSAIVLITTTTTASSIARTRTT
eukprot:GHVT01043040.1.p1 GENE.GHVT01043040.1~~GHVT01043040.1.p1  ORF type:complete len:246 (+),score=47.49 GHVT01043040.1:648-1385(+)